MGGGPVKKKVTYSVPPEPSWVKHTRPKKIVYTFSDACYARPLPDQTQIHLTSEPSPRRKRDDTSAHHTPRLGASKTPREEHGASFGSRTPRDLRPLTR